MKLTATERLMLAILERHGGAEARAIVQDCYGSPVPMPESAIEWAKELARGLPDVQPEPDSSTP